MKIAYCGYDFFSACLQELLTTGFDIHRVFTFACDNRNDFNQYMYDICNRYDKPITEQRIDDGTIAELAEQGCDVLITAGYRYKIPDLSGTNIKGINIHPTLLPLGRGVFPLPGIILTRQLTSGVSIHKLTQNYDAGDILMQKSFPLDNNDNLESLSAKSQITAKTVLPDLLNNIDEYWSAATPQSGQASHWELPSTQQRTFNWRQQVEELDRTSRAFGKLGCFGTFDNKSWIIYLINGWTANHHYTPGEVAHKTNTETIIAVADGFVSLLYFEPATLAHIHK